MNVGAVDTCRQTQLMQLIRAFDAMYRGAYGAFVTQPDLNLLSALAVLLEEGSVARTARRMRLSPSAMSRTLARLRAATGDPLLVRAGRGLVPTPRALELSSRVGPLVEEVTAVLRPAQGLVLSTIERTFTIATGDGFVETFGPALLERISQEAPRARLHFVAKAARGSKALREGSVELETGVLEESAAPELKVQALFRDRLVGVVRPSHPLSRGRVTASRYAKANHVDITRHIARSTGWDPIDAGLAKVGVERRVVVAVVGGFATALSLARARDLVATVPELHTRGLSAGMQSFALPFPTPDLAISMLWHARLDADPAHRWLRGSVRAVCSSVALGARTTRTTSSKR